MAMLRFRPIGDFDAPQGYQNLVSSILFDKMKYALKLVLTCYVFLHIRLFRVPAMLFCSWLGIVIC